MRGFQIQILPIVLPIIQKFVTRDLTGSPVDISHSFFTLVFNCNVSSSKSSFVGQFFGAGRKGKQIVIFLNLPASTMQTNNMCFLKWWCLTILISTNNMTDEEGENFTYNPKTPPFPKEGNFIIQIKIGQ